VGPGQATEQVLGARKGRPSPVAQRGLVVHTEGREERKRVRTLFLRGGNGRAGAGCAVEAAAGEDPRNDCGADGVGGSIDLENVDVVAADGTSSSNVRVSVRGGNAASSIHCFNVATGEGKVLQRNICSATSSGGSAILANVTIHVFRE
jgi:hypothetical protein